MSFQQRHVQMHFDRAAADYDRFAYVQQKVLEKLVGRAQKLFVPDGITFDIGCGTGALARLLQTKKLSWQIRQMDIARAMCQKAQQNATPTIQAAIEALPFATASGHQVFSSLTLQWVDNMPQAFAEMYRVLKPDGYVVAATFGPHTLQELKQSFAAGGALRHVHPFREASELKSTAEKAGFTGITLEAALYTDYYDNVWSLMQALKAIGATNALQGRNRGLARRQDFEKMEQHYEARYRNAEGLPVSWEVIYLSMKKPA